MENVLTNINGKSYYELYIITKFLCKEQRKKIPKDFMQYIIKNMEINKEFKIDLSKNILEQNFLPETKALLIQVYKKFIAPSNETEFWNKYDKICLDNINEEKSKKYNTDNLFNNSNIKTLQESNTEYYENLNNFGTNTAMIEYEEPSKNTVFSKIKRFFKNIFRKDK